MCTIPCAVKEGLEGTECSLLVCMVPANLGRPGISTDCAFKWPVWGVPLNDMMMMMNKAKLN
jgi:hypothetical protein